MSAVENVWGLEGVEVVLLYTPFPVTRRCCPKLRLSHVHLLGCFYSRLQKGRGFGMPLPSPDYNVTQA